jgi:hypothetical protein
MVAGGGPHQYAQAGYLRLQGMVTVYPFFEDNRGDGHKDFKKLDTPASGTHRYFVTYDRSAGKMRMGMDGTTYLSSSFDPPFYWWSPWEAQWDGEVHDLGDDIAGTASHPVYFSNLSWQTSAGGSWVMPWGLDLVSDSDRYAYAWDSDDQFHIWTK